MVYQRKKINIQGWPSGLGNKLIICARQVQLLHPGLNFNQISEKKERAEKSQSYYQGVSWAFSYRYFLQARLKISVIVRHDSNR